VKADYVAVKDNFLSLRVLTPRKLLVKVPAVVAPASQRISLREPIALQDKNGADAFVISINSLHQCPIDGYV
jgi:hypothetical protein